MSSQGKVLPVAADEFTSVSTICGGDIGDHGPDNDTQRQFAEPLPPLASAASTHSNDTVVKYLHGRVSEHVGSERDMVAPLIRDSVPFHEGAFFQSALVTKSSLSPHRTPTLKKTGTLQGLLGPQLSRAELKALERERIERKVIPKNHSLHDRAAYQIDKYISTRKGQTTLLTFVGLVLIILGGCILKASQPSMSFHEMVWQSWTFLGDAGSHTALTETGLRIIGVVMTLVGILYFSVIMGFVVDGIRDKMDSLKKGKSKVAEDKHTLMLGWTDKSISLIRQICLANASEKGGTIVVLAEAEKEDLEAELASHLRPEELRGTNVIFRTGTPLLSVDLLKVAAHRARSIVIMALSSGDADRSDAAVLRTVLSLKTLPELAGHIVAELRDIDNEPLVRLVGGESVEILVSHDVVGRLVLMAARSLGLARVFKCLLGFDGNEFYFKEWPECTGVRFGELAERFPNAIPLGIKRKSGEVLIAPDFNMALQAGDQIMVLAEDDDTYKACPPAEVVAGSVPNRPPKQQQKERILMCGWRRDIRDMIQLLDAVVMPQTELHMLCEEPCHLRNKLLMESGLNVDTLKNLVIVHHYGNTAVRRHLETLPLHTFTSMMILSDESRETDIMHSDSHTLASLLLVRDLQRKMGKKAGRILTPEESCKCICEVLDPRTQRTISTSETILKLSEFIQSNELISCILAMISESRDVRVILDELLGPNGASFEVEHFTRYCTSSDSVSFWQLAKRAMTMGEILCGYQLRGAVDETILNPNNKSAPQTWVGFDFIVLRRTDDAPIIHQPAPQPIHADDFERTTRNRMGKSSFVRQQILEALVQEQEVAHIENLNGQERDLLTKAVQSYVSSEKTDMDATPIDARSVRSIISVARILADTLERYENNHTGSFHATRHGSIDSSDEKVTEFDLTTNL